MAGCAGGDVRTSVLPMHSSELKTGLVEGIKKQLGLKGKQ